MNIFEKFEKEDYAFYTKRDETVKKLISDFTRDFPREKIMEITLENYLIAKEGYGNPDSFCRRLRYQMDEIAHMGNVYYHVFGLYLNNGTELTASDTIKNKFGNDYETAFDYIKAQIIKLLDDFEREDYDAVEANEINSSFKYKLLMIYFPDKIVPVCTKNTLDNYCLSVKIDFSSKDKMIFRNLALLNWKNSIPEICDWTNNKLMCFCDWLVETNQKIDYERIKIDSLVCKVNSISNEIDGLNLKGESRDALVKVRVNQDIFRNLLLKKYHKCCLCGVSITSVLIASHIKPWKESTAEEKLDVDNGLLLCPNHDKLFDRYLISFDDDGKIMIDNNISEDDRKALNIDENMTITLTGKNKEYLKVHRNKFNTK